LNKPFTVYGINVQTLISYLLYVYLKLTAGQLEVNVLSIKQ